MPKVAVYNMQGATVGEIELSDDIFGVEINEPVLHAVVRAQLNNKRQGTKSTLTRAEVRGGGRKPWRQKGTGRARQGSTRAPQWTKGGVVFAPKPRDFSMTVPKKVRRLAMKSALSSKVSEGEMIVLDALDLPEAKTREMVKVLKALSADRKALIVLDAKNEGVQRASSNLRGVTLAYVNTINVLDILKHDKFIVLRDAVAQIQEVYV